MALVRWRFRGKAVAQRADRPAVRRLAGGHRPGADPGLRPTGWFGGWLADHGIQVIFSIPGMVMATMFVSLPFVVREVVPVLREIGTDQEQAAADARRLGLADVLADHAAVDPLGRDLRRRADHGARARRVRRGAVVSGKISARPRRSPCYVENRFQQFDLAGAYAASVVLAAARRDGHRVDEAPRASAKGRGLMAIEVRNVSKSSATSRRSTTSRWTSPTAR